MCTPLLVLISSALSVKHSKYSYAFIKLGHVCDTVGDTPSLPPILDPQQLPYEWAGKVQAWKI